MTAMERVLTTMSHKEPDRVPNFTLLTMHGAKELGIDLKQYFNNPEAVIEAQILLQKKFDIDCYNGFLYASVEIEALGGEVIFIDDGPPNSGAPVLTSAEGIKNFQFPDIKDSEPLMRVLRVINELQRAGGGNVPVLGAVMSPFSLPVMQLGFERYIDIMFNDEPLFKVLLEKNIEFCIRWANAQLDAGATAICYFDPISGPSMVPRQQFLSKGFPVLKEILSQVRGPIAMHMASGRILPILDDVSDCGIAGVGVSVLESLSDIKQKARNKVTVIGNLNAIEMCEWDELETEKKVRETISNAAAGGGFILSDNHGEIPYQVSDETLFALSDAVKKWGRYPIQGAG